jgi:hypothetical protein
MLLRVLHWHLWNKLHTRGSTRYMWVHSMGCYLVLLLVWPA